jgi:CheY-like chemotaxis protein
MNIRIKNTVLIADDDERFLTTVKGIVEGEGLETEVAGCGLEALAIVRRVPVSLTILDVQMPDISGLETYRRIRKVRWPLPCIFVTGSLSEEVRREALSTGAFSILEKTVDVSVFRTTVLEAIANSI